MKILIVIGMAVAVVGFTHAKFEVMIQLITCPLVKIPERVDPVPALTPSTVH